MRRASQSAQSMRFLRDLRKVAAVRRADARKTSGPKAKAVCPIARARHTAHRDEIWENEQLAALEAPGRRRPTFFAHFRYRPLRRVRAESTSLSPLEYLTASVVSKALKTVIESCTWTFRAMLPRMANAHLRIARVFESSISLKLYRSCLGWVARRRDARRSLICKAFGQQPD